MWTSDKKLNVAITAAMIALGGLALNMLGVLDRVFRIPARVEALEKTMADQVALQREFYQFRAEIQARVGNIESGLNNVTRQQSEVLGQLSALTSQQARIHEGQINLKEALKEFAISIDARLAERRP